MDSLKTEEEQKDFFIPTVAISQRSNVLSNVFRSMFIPRKN